MKNTSVIYRHPRKTKGKIYDRAYLYIPSQVMRQPEFFKYGEKVVIEWDNEKKQWYLIKLDSVEEEIKTNETDSENTNTQINEKEEKEIMKEKEKLKKPRKGQTKVIECPKCHKENVLISDTSTERKCTYCGLNIKREDYRFVAEKPHQTKLQGEGSGGVRQ